MKDVNTVLSGLKKRVKFRKALENGILLLPDSIAQYAVEEPLVKNFWHSLWNNFLNNEAPVSTTYWFDRIDNVVLFNRLLETLSNEGWVSSIVLQPRHWAEVTLRIEKVLDYIEQDMLTAIRKEVKFNRFKLLNKPANHSNVTKQNGVKSDTGLVREGFTRAGNTKFKYDTDMLYKYFTPIVRNVVKSMRLYDEANGTDSTLDQASYMNITKEIIEYHMYSPDEEFTLGENYNDSRGRAISTALKRVFNPISCKDARALLVLDKPQLVTDVGSYLEAMYLFIAELCGVKRIESAEAKAEKGREFYEERHLPELDYNNEEDLKDLHELIWLERIYNELDIILSMDTAPKYTSIPIELDASASMLQIEGALLNHRTFLELTNVIGKEVNDPWYVEGITRKQVKFHATPTLYGSSQTAETLWKKNNVSYTRKHVATMNYEIQNGQFAVANAFKEMLIEHVRPSETMQVVCWKDTFTIKCNRFRNVGEYTKRYPLYSSDEKQIIPIVHTHTKHVPDLKQFRRYFPTLLIHNIDSKIADTICLNESIDWIISIHDAFLVSATTAKTVRSLYSEQIEEVYRDRANILNNFFSSIRISNKAQKDWADLQELVVPFEGKFTCNALALK